MSRYVLVAADVVKTGGMDRANYALAAHLANQGRDVHLVSFRIGDALLHNPNITWHKVPKLLRSDLLSLPILNQFGRAWARRLGGQVIVNGGNCVWNDVNWLHHLNVLDHPPLVGSWPRRFKRTVARRYFIARERASLRRARLIVTTCERNRNDLLNWLDIPADRVEVVYYGTDPELFRPAAPHEKAALRAAAGLPADVPIAGFVGALGDRRKGFDTLFEAWRMLASDPAWDAVLAVVGAGSELPAWRARAEAAGLTQKLIFLGFRRDVPTLFRAFDAHVLPSRYEGYSLVTQEALCCGLPAFVTAAAGIAERYPDDLRDLLIPNPNDPADLAARLRAWQADPNRWSRPLAPFAESLRAYTWDHMAARFVLALDRRSPRPL
ncbi:MAG: glycosyltransferase family 4 protein [Planctomycetota bacterium]|nr:glycosyltransferase family 4 protein [Planctomycetota bacterium]